MLKEIPINKGVYQNVEAFELASPEYATILKNFLLNDSGSNVDRPGLVDFAPLGSLIVIGVKFFKGLMCAVTSDRRIYCVDSVGTVTDITGDAVLLGTARPTFANDGTYLAIAGGGTPRRWVGLAATPTELMPGSPPDLTFISYLDGYWLGFETDSQVVVYAGPTAVLRETWSPGNFFSAESSPDNIAAQFVLFREYYAIGTDSFEVWQNIGSALPFARTFVFDKGTIAPYSVLQADNTLWFLDSDRRFVRIDQRTPQLISSPYDRVIKRFTTVSDCWGARIDIDGYYLILWAFPTEQRAFVYDYLRQQWGEWNSYRDSTERFIAINCYDFARTWNKHIVGGSYSDVLSQLTFSAKLDGAETIRRVRRTGHVTHGTANRKRSNFFQFTVKRGQGTPGDTEPVFEFRVNDDNGGWTDFIQVPLGFPGGPEGAIRVDFRGIYRARQIEWVVTEPVDFILAKVEEDVELLTS